MSRRGYVPEDEKQFTGKQLESLQKAADEVQFLLDRIQFAAFKKHIGLYPGPEAVETFADKLKEYKTSKGAIRLPYDKPLPLELIGEIAKWCEKENGC